MTNIRFSNIHASIRELTMFVKGASSRLVVTNFIMSLNTVLIYCSPTHLSVVFVHRAMHAGLYLCNVVHRGQTTSEAMDTEPSVLRTPRPLVDPPSVIAPKVWLFYCSFLTTHSINVSILFLSSVLSLSSPLFSDLTLFTSHPLFLNFPSLC